MREYQRFRLFSGNGLAVLRIFPVLNSHGNDASGQASHGSVHVRDDLHSASRDQGVFQHLLEDVVCVSGRIIQYAPALKGGLSVPAQERKHGPDHPFRVLVAFDGLAAA